MRGKTSHASGDAEALETICFKQNGWDKRLAEAIALPTVAKQTLPDLARQADDKLSNPSLKKPLALHKKIGQYV